MSNILLSVGPFLSDHIWPILSGLFACSNIFQFIFFSASKQKAYAEAESMDLDNKQKALSIKLEASGTLLKQCDDLQEKFIAMSGELQNALIEVAQLRATLVTKDARIELLERENEKLTKENESLKSKLSHYGEV